MNRVIIQGEALFTNESSQPHQTIEASKSNNDSIKSVQSMNLNTMIDYWIKQQEEKIINQEDGFDTQRIQTHFETFKKNLEEYYRNTESNQINNKISAMKIDHLIEKLLYKKIDPKNKMQRVRCSQAPEKLKLNGKLLNDENLREIVDTMIENGKKKQIHKPHRIQSAIKGKTYSFQLGDIPFSSTRPLSTHVRQRNFTSFERSRQTTQNKSNQQRPSTSIPYKIYSQTERIKSVSHQDENTSRKDILLKIQSAQQKMNRYYLNSAQKKKKQNIETQNKSLGILNYEQIDEYLRWWPLEKLQKFLLEKKLQETTEQDTFFITKQLTKSQKEGELSENSLQNDSFLLGNSINLQKRNSIYSAKKISPRVKQKSKVNNYLGLTNEANLFYQKYQRSFYISNFRRRSNKNQTGQQEDLGTSIKIISKCNQILSESKHTYKIINEGQQNVIKKLDSISATEEEIVERQKEKQRLEYEKQEVKQVLNSFKQQKNTNTRAFQMYNPYYERRMHTKAKVLINAMRINFQKLSDQRQS